MLALQKLNVSLTKHGAHKIALLLRKYDKDSLLTHLWGQEPGINIEGAQARKNLSVGKNDVVPTLWNEVRKLGPRAIDALVLVAIIFSHHQLIKAMIRSQTGPYRGTIIRGKQLDGKAFTNFAYIIEQLGFSTEHSDQSVSYDLQPIFKIHGLNRLVLNLLKLKLREAGWDESTHFNSAVAAHRLNAALGLTASQFKSWMSSGAIHRVPAIVEDEAFFAGADEPSKEGMFTFKPGHKARKTGTVGVRKTSEDIKASLVHNELQTLLYRKLSKLHGKQYVGTEVQTGQGTNIDVVVETPTFRWFFEIKIAASVRACIRQAIPQLLEYSYWKGSDISVNKLIIVSTFPLTAQAEKYLNFLREKFGLPFHYEQHELPKVS